MIIAGSETSATLLSGSVFYLGKNPSIMKRLTQEIRSAFATSQEMTFRNTSNLSYLNAVVEESLRIYPPFVTSLARIPPSSGAYVDGNWVPENVRLPISIVSYCR
jgi:cytochrome P450